MSLDGFEIPSLDGLDLNNHDSLVPEIRRINGVFIAVIALVVGLRVFVRIRFVKHFGLDDIFMVLAGVFAIAFAALALAGARVGEGRHEWDLDIATVIEVTKKIIKILWGCQMMYSTALSLVKLSIIVSYLRVFPVPVFRRIMFTIGTAIILVWVSSILATVFQCIPVRGAWDFTLEDKKCFPVVRYYYFSNSFNILTDLLLCTLPMPLFWKLNLPRKERIILCLLFMLGLFATVASIFRLTQLHRLGSVDVSFTTVPSLNWSILEVGTGIVCACVPTLKPLFRRILPETIFSSAKHTGASRASAAKSGGEPEYEMSKERPYTVNVRAFDSNKDGDEDGIMAVYQHQQAMRHMARPSVATSRPDTSRPGTMSETVMGRVEHV